jgi:hypothetical protein
MPIETALSRDAPTCRECGKHALAVAAHATTARHPAAPTQLPLAGA